MRRGAPRRIDANQPEIVDALQKAGYCVCDISSVGCGCPDLIVGIPGRPEVFLLEIKNPKSGGRLNKLQQQWHDAWPGQVAIVWTVEEALSVLDSAAVDAKSKFGYLRDTPII